MGFGNRVMQPGSGLSDRDDEDQIEEQFEGCRGAMRLVWRASAHRRHESRSASRRRCG